jgi:hypothetical protein
VVLCLGLCIRCIGWSEFAEEFVRNLMFASRFEYAVCFLLFDDLLQIRAFVMVMLFPSLSF